MVGLAGPAIPGAAALAADQPESAIDAYLRAAMAGSSIPGLAVAVVEDGYTTYAAALDAPPAAVDAITVGSLLSHTSGLSTADGKDSRWCEPGLTPDEVATLWYSGLPPAPKRGLRR